MLEFLRRQSQSWLVWVAIGVITIVFIFFFGPQAGGLQSGGKSWAMRVDNTKIYDSQLESALGRIQALGQRYDDEERYAVKREIGYDLALVKVLADEAKDAGLSISDDELNCYIVNWNRRYKLNGKFICEQFPRTYSQLYPNLDAPFYSDRDGGFSKDYGKDVRRWFNESVSSYERYKRNELLALRYLSLLSASIPVTAEEIEHRWRLENDGVDLELAIFDFLDEDELNIQDEEVEAFAESNASAIENYYNEHKEDFAVARETTLRRIYLRKPEDLDSEQAKKERVESILKEAQAEDADFAALVEKYSENEREVEKGGDMGARADDSLAPEFVEGIEKTDVGGVFLVEQAYAWSIVQITAQQAEGIQPLEDVRKEVATRLLAEEKSSALKKQYRAMATDLLARAKENTSETLRDILNDLDGTENVRVTQTGVFGPMPKAPDLSGISPELRPYIQISSREVGEIPQLGVAPELAKKASKLEPESPVLDEIGEVDGKFVVIRLKERAVAEEIPEDEANAIRQLLAMERSESVLGFGVAQRRILLHSGDPLPALLKAMLDKQKISFNEKLFQAQVQDEG